MIKPYYETELGKLYHGDCLEILPQLTEKVDLVLTDPPYFEIKGEFDFGRWEDFSRYLVDVEKWAIQMKRLLKENGTLYWFGDDKRIAYTQIIFDKYFGLINNLVWWKYNLRGGVFGSSGSDNIRSFPICTERLLMYSNDVYNLTQCVYLIRDYIRTEIIKAKGKIILRDINHALGTATTGGGVASACLSLDKKEPAMFTKGMYERLRCWLNNGSRKYEYLRREYEDLRREYEDLRREYEDLRRPYNNKRGLTEVLQFNTDTTNNFGHETVKPISLIITLMEISSHFNNLVLDPFLGSGTTAVACERLGRRWIGIEISKDYCDIAVKRIEEERSQLKLPLGG